VKPAWLVGDAPSVQRPDSREIGQMGFWRSTTSRSTLLDSAFGVGLVSPRQGLGSYALWRWRRDIFEGTPLVRARVGDHVMMVRTIPRQSE
jgi:hypothetical protein